MDAVPIDSIIVKVHTKKKSERQFEVETEDGLIFWLDEEEIDDYEGGTDSLLAYFSSKAKEKQAPKDVKPFPLKRPTTQSTKRPRPADMTREERKKQKETQRKINKTEIAKVKFAIQVNQSIQGNKQRHYWQNLFKKPKEQFKNIIEDLKEVPENEVAHDPERFLPSFILKNHGIFFSTCLNYNFEPSEILQHLYYWPLRYSSCPSIPFQGVENLFPKFNSIIEEISNQYHQKKKMEFIRYQDSLPKPIGNLPPPALNKDVCCLIFNSLPERTLFKLKLVSKNFLKFVTKTILKNRMRWCRLCNQQFHPKDKSECKGHLAPPIVLADGAAPMYSCCPDGGRTCYEGPHQLDSDRQWSLTPRNGWTVVKLEENYHGGPVPAIHFDDWRAHLFTMNEHDLRQLATLMGATGYRHSINELFEASFIFKSHVRAERASSNSLRDHFYYFYYRTIPVEIPRVLHRPKDLKAKETHGDKYIGFGYFGGLFD